MLCRGYDPVSVGRICVEELLEIEQQMFAAPTANSYRVLIGDDDSRCRESLASLLHFEGFHTLRVDGGLATLDLLREHMLRRLAELEWQLEQRQQLEQQQLEQQQIEQEQTESQTTTIDFLVLDYNMPDLSGLEVLRQVREEAQDVWYQRIEKRWQVARTPESLLPPAIVVSGEASAELARSVLNLGGFALVAKPIRPVEFREQVWKLVRCMLDNTEC